MKRIDRQSILIRMASILLVTGLVTACGSRQTAPETANLPAMEPAAPTASSSESSQQETVAGEPAHEDESVTESAAGPADHEMGEAGNMEEHMEDAGDPASTDDHHSATDEAAHGHEEAAESHEDMAAMHGIPVEAAAQENPIPADAGSVERGAMLFQTTCAVCHGPEGKGDGPGAAGLEPKPANLSEEHVQGNSDGALFYTISNGVVDTAMVGWAEVYSEEDRWHLVNFLRTFAE